MVEAAARQGHTANCREQKVDERGFRKLRTLEQWVAEIAYHPQRLDSSCRMVVRRIRIEEKDGQGALFAYFRYRENVIEQFGEGIAGWRMPVAEFLGNSAWRQIARLAWNLGKWIAEIALSSEVVRWEWKRFCRHFVYIAAKVLKKGRRLVVQLTDSHRYLPEILAAHARLQV